MRGDVPVDGAARNDDLLDNIRRVSACECSALDVAILGLGDREIAVLAGQLTKVAAHIAARVGSARGLPPPGTLPGPNWRHAGSRRPERTLHLAPAMPTHHGLTAGLHALPGWSSWLGVGHLGLVRSSGPDAAMI
ncbi:hypothetical protein GCM10027089_32710 [Nocardia thraciensis]